MVNCLSAKEKPPLKKAAEPEPPLGIFVKMIIFTRYAPPKIIGFTQPPNEDCTLQDVLDKYHIPCYEDTHVESMQTDNGTIAVSVGLSGIVGLLLNWYLYNVLM